MSKAKRVRKARMKKRQERNAKKAGLYFAWLEYDAKIDEFREIALGTGTVRITHG
jgi:hypothetical protein